MSKHYDNPLEERMIELEEEALAAAFIDFLFDVLTDMEAAVLILLLEGWTRQEIAQHFEFHRTNVDFRWKRIVTKAKEIRDKLDYPDWVETP